jgi:hypothetical protein
MPSSQTPLTLADKIRIALSADPKRTGILAGLTLILLILCVRAMQSGPATGAASPVSLPGSLNLPSPEGMTAERSGSSNALLEWLAQPKHAAKRNLFSIRLDAYPKDPRGAPPAAESNSSDESAKSLTSLADQTGVQDSLAKQAAKLKLQSTFLGPIPTALVNGQLVREGDTIGLFQVVRIEPRSVSIRHAGITLQISMD